MKTKDDMRDFEDEDRPLFGIGDDGEMPTIGMSPEQFSAAIEGLMRLDPSRLSGGLGDQ